MCEHQARGDCRMCEQEMLEEHYGTGEEHIDDEESNTHASRVAAQLRMAEQEEDGDE